ncbi:MAG: tRNA preQ1(34) S-adenosylmethionine ribosyltransferase-isomerase QueA [Myxococcota bacterium]
MPTGRVTPSSEPPRLADYDFALPPERIAQQPLAERDAARLLVLDRHDGATEHRVVRDLPALLRAGDLLVANATRVEPARLRGHKQSGGRAEALLLGPAARPGEWRALVRARALRVGTKLVFERGADALEAEVTALADGGEVTLACPPDRSPYALGETPLPPYIRRDEAQPEDAERYQTVFARVPGAVAAPTAGLHLTEALLAALASAGIGFAELVLHVGPGTFRPLREADLAAGRLHAETFELPAETAAAIARARERGGRVVAVGTTSVRVLEARARDDGTVEPGHGETDLFLRPGRRFRVVDALLTNFHLPRSSLLLLVAAFAGREPILAAYQEAIAAGYRFYSYGDAMLIR